MIYTTPPLTRSENAKGAALTIGFLILWAVGAVITRNGDWLDKCVKRPEDK